jgi:hypothetical protein
VSTLLTVLRLMYGNYTEAPAQQEQQQQEVDPATGQPLQVKRLAPAGDYVADYRLAVQMWVPREQSKPRWVVNIFVFFGWFHNLPMAAAAHTWDATSTFF